MEDALLSSLRARRTQTRARWEALLRIERVTTPLAHPDTLVHLIDTTLDEVLSLLSHKPPRRGSGRPLSYASIRAKCGCGRNPLLMFFIAGEQAMLEAAVLAQSELPLLDPASRNMDIAEIYHTFRHLANREVEAFCAVCQYRTAPEPEQAAPSCPPSAAPASVPGNAGVLPGVLPFA